MNKIPKGWLDYKPYGDKVQGTMLLPLKTPLKEKLVHGIPKEQRFTPAILMGDCPKLRAIIDLTATSEHADRYYSPKEFIEGNVDHYKLRIEGGGLVPGSDKIKMFSDAVDGFVKKYSDDPDAFIGVHCTHGLNRTGYFICQYMVTRMGFEPKDAIAKFQNARGYEMYRQNFIEEIITPGIHTNQRQKPDYRRHKNTVRPIRPDYGIAPRRAVFSKERSRRRVSSDRRAPTSHELSWRSSTTSERKTSHELSWRSSTTSERNAHRSNQGGMPRHPRPFETNREYVTNSSQGNYRMPHGRGPPSRHPEVFVEYSRSNEQRMRPLEKKLISPWGTHPEPPREMYPVLHHDREIDLRSQRYNNSVEVSPFTHLPQTSFEPSQMNHVRERQVSREKNHYQRWRMRRK